eukprot:CFRG7690T1
MSTRIPVAPAVGLVVLGVALSTFVRKIAAVIAAGKENIYETACLVNQYLVFHYGKPSEVCGYANGPKDALDFPVRVAAECWLAEAGKSKISRALDIGCAVGRSSFELAGHFDEVIGIDFSQHFIDVANDIKKNGVRDYAIIEEGNLCTPCIATVDPSIDRSRVTFQHGDACNLSEELGQFSAVLAANLVCRLPNPRKFLRRLPSLVAQGGVVVIASPYTFLEEFTPKKQWLGGYHGADGKPVWGCDTIRDELAEHFDLINEMEHPFFIRETAHKNQWSVSHTLVFRRR